ncbi:ATP-binding protein [Streptomyces sp. 4N509B]|uniref:ATP-binding protein n=1 Tax=Streptomyces sp. 4N509B TaxID=3457413 RepID=UPI003FD17120
MTAVTPTCHLSATFAATTKYAAEVRRLVRAHLRTWGYAGTFEIAALATGELFANAVEHGSDGPEDMVTVSLDCEVTRLRIAVTDSSPVLPCVRAVDLMAERGRGLAIVNEVSERWGAEAAEDGSGKRVWCTIDIDSDIDVDEGPDSLHW